MLISLELARQQTNFYKTTIILKNHKNEFGYSNTLVNYAYRIIGCMILIQPTSVLYFQRRCKVRLAFPFCLVQRISTSFLLFCGVFCRLCCYCYYYPVQIDARMHLHGNDDETRTPLFIARSTHAIMQRCDRPFNVCTRRKITTFQSLAVYNHAPGKIEHFLMAMWGNWQE